jgi:hypothetical protein
MALELDHELKRLNEDYDAKRNGGALDAPFVRLVMPGVFEHWMRHHGKWGGDNKMPRCRSDRVIADELGGRYNSQKTNGLARPMLIEDHPAQSRVLGSIEPASSRPD